MNELIGGNQDSQWIELTGLVRSAVVQSFWNRPTLVLSLDTGDGVVSVRVMDFSSGGYENLPDAVVRVRGVCATIFNDRRQFVGIRMFVPSLREIFVAKAGYQQIQQPLVTGRHPAFAV